MPIKRHTFFSKLSYPLFALLLGALCGCGSTVDVPVDSREFPEAKQSKQQAATETKKTTQARPEPVEQAANVESYIVQRGDTLYSIAWRFGHDFRSIAEWNGVHEPYLIYPGQKLSLKPSAQAVKAQTPKLQPGPVVSEDQTVTKPVKQKTQLQPKPVSDDKKTENITAKPPAKQQVKSVETKPTAKKKPKTVTTTAKLQWQWPTQGKLVRSKKATSKKGINISGKLGQAIKSSADGHVVYSGSGLLGYGRLIIVKHNETYLSAYAHNSELLVQEGDNVAVGQTIAKMGTTSSGQALLHFEIRKNGKSVNPLTFLPKQ